MKLRALLPTEGSDMMQVTQANVSAVVRIAAESYAANPANNDNTDAAFRAGAAFAMKLLRELDAIEDTATGVYARAANALLADAVAMAQGAHR